jgi:DNA invertase Pin-like site-specific DNA recombinase
MKRVAIYLRVSTTKQDTANQLRELEGVAERSGWDVVRIFEDVGISGAKGRDKRPGLHSMMKAVNNKRFDMVMAWSVDRLGRSLTDLLGILQGLHDKGVDLFLHQQGIDTSTSAGRAMYQMLGVFAEFEGASSGSGSMLGLLAPRRTAQSSGDAVLSPRSRRAYWS